MKRAQQQLLLEGALASGFAHKGIIGDERAASLASFFRERLPDRFGVHKGEAIDHRDTRTGQLDFVIYDRSRCAPIQVGNENLLLPCEALYCVIEVKTRITQDELEKAYLSARKVRSLRPFKRPFIAARKKGSDAEDGRSRCLYIVFGYTSNLGSDSEWVQKECNRLRSASKSAKTTLDCIDRLFVLDRGIINPQKPAGKWLAGDADSVFLESYLHIMNFLGRESQRRDPVDWQMYGPRSSKGWKSIA
jgi:hypothetical protein